MIKKILSKNELLTKVKYLKNNKKKIVLCHGVFDLYHIGHLKHFEFAKSYGDILIVSLTKNKFINKGFGKPVFNEYFRSELLSSIECIDFIYLSESQSSEDVINLVKPNYYCKGIEYKNKEDVTKKIKSEINCTKRNGGKVIFSKEVTFSSSNLLNANFNIFNDEQKNFLKKIREKINEEDLKEIFYKISKLKTLVIGEVILDEYVFTEAVGKSGKEPILILREDKRERYIGGAGAIAKNISNFCKNKTFLISFIGQKKDHLREINKFLGSKVKSFFIPKQESKTIIKRRYIDLIGNSKLFGIYNFDNKDLKKSEEDMFLEYIKKNISNKDVIIVADYGHGLITKKIRSFLTKSKKFISLNVQLNASNIGYHNFDFYNNCSCIVINERELRHEMRDKKSDIKNLIINFSNMKLFKYILITRGNQGLMLYNLKDKKFHECCAFADIIIDKVGAGDIILSIFSLCLKLKIDLDVALFISSVAAVDKLKNYANKEFIYPEKILKSIIHMIK